MEAATVSRRHIILVSEGSAGGATSDGGSDWYELTSGLAALV